MFQIIRFFSVVLNVFFITSFPAFAGDPGPLCTAVKRSNYIFEVKLNGTLGNYSELYIKKSWSPKSQELEKIEKDAVIHKVYKGDLKEGALLKKSEVKDFPLFLGSGGDTSIFWKQFFQSESMIFLTGDGLGSWQADLTGPYFSFQARYPSFKKRVLDCLKK